MGSTIDLDYRLRDLEGLTSGNSCQITVGDKIRIIGEREKIMSNKYLLVKRFMHDINQIYLVTLDKNPTMNKIHYSSFDLYLNGFAV